MQSTFFKLLIVLANRNFASVSGRRYERKDIFIAGVSPSPSPQCSTLSRFTPSHSPIPPCLCLLRRKLCHHISANKRIPTDEKSLFTISKVSLKLFSFLYLVSEKRIDALSWRVTHRMLYCSELRSRAL